MDVEGTEICDWLTSQGIACVLLKYRVPDSGPWWDKENHRRVYPKVQTALQDAQRTLGLVRQHAAQWHVDPHKIGVIGFSAADTWWPRSVRILRSGPMLQWTPPTN